MGRVLLIEDDIGGERSSPVHALEEVMAGEPVFRHTPGDAAHEPIDIVDALAAVDAGAKQILIELR